MKFYGMLLMSAVSFGLVACSGGGGGGGSDTTTTTGTVLKPETTPTTPTSPTTPVAPVYEGGKSRYGVPLIAPAKEKSSFGSNASLVYYPEDKRSTRKDIPGFDGIEFESIGNLVLPDERYAEIWKSGDKDVVLIEGDVQPKITNFAYDISSWIFDSSDPDNIAVGGISYLDEDKNPISFYSINDAALDNVKTSAIKDSAWTWSNVYYAYSAIGKSGEKTQLSSGTNDGSITKDGNKWTAKFGNVNLEGTINGNEVAGTAKGNFFGQTLEGKFAGLDGSLTHLSYEDDISLTFGGFAGGNNTATFAGGWHATKE